MPLDRETLETELNNVLAQKDRHRDLYQQAAGAEQLLRNQIERLTAAEAADDTTEEVDDVS